ncbi:hypothetical protein [Dokdonella sp.]|uniref:hypothetical protein n=1 Tax=Dokdonella sp. TaxID=2291710 RepID=UPI002F4260C7
MKLRLLSFCAFVFGASFAAVAFAGDPCNCTAVWNQCIANGGTQSQCQHQLNVCLTRCGL